MSQYIADNSQRFYQPTFQYTAPQNNYFVLQSQRNQPIRQPSLNRNNSVSSSMILKPGKIQQNHGGKLRRQNSMKNSIEFKENDPYAKNMHLSGNINKLPFTPKDQNDYISEYDPKNTFCNPLIVKRQKITKDFSRQKIPIHPQTRQNTIQNLKNSQNSKNSIYQKQYEILSQKIVKMQSLINENFTCITEHKTKIQKLQDFYQNDISKSQHNRRHSRSISTNNSATPTFKQLSDIMSLIEQSKNYQIKNSQEYRKMIEEFRSTILEFREDLNKTAKKQDIDLQLQKLKQSLNGNTSGSLSRKGSTQYSASHSFLIKSKQMQTIQKIEKQISLIKVSIDKLQQSNTSIKADMVKYNVRDKKASDQVQLTIVQMNRKLQNLQKQIVPFNQSQYRKGAKYDGAGICFIVSQQLMSCVKGVVASQNNNRKIYPQSRFAHSSVVEYEQGSKISIPQSPLSQDRQGLRLNEKMYYIDKDGYLLDEQNYYLMNEKNEQIRLSQNEIQVLKKLGVMG